MSIHGDYTHASFQQVLRDRPFELNLREDELEELEKNIEGYRLFYAFLLTVLEDSLATANGIHSTSLRAILKVKLEADICVHRALQDGINPEVFLGILNEINRLFSYGVKLANPLIFCREECGDSLLDESFGILYELHMTSEEALPYLEYDNEAYILVYRISKEAEWLLDKLVEYRAGLDMEQEELAPTIGHEANELFINRLGLEPFNELPLELRLEYLEAWEPILRRHRLALSAYFELPESPENAEELDEAKKMLESIREISPNNPDKMMSFIRDVFGSLGVRLKALREHCTKTPLPLFLDKYEKLYEELRPVVLNSLN